MSRTRELHQARLLALLAVLLGLLAMHGLVSTHHGAAATPAAYTAHAAAPAEAQNHDHHQQAAAALTAASAGAALPAPACHDDCPDALTMLCVAVLAGIATAGLLARRRARWSPARAARQRWPRAPDVAHRRPARPDPVAELCVSRT